MSMLSNPAFGPRLAVTYVTIGALIDVWTGVWYYSFARADGLPPNQWFWVTGFFLTGLTLMIIGLLIGPLGQYARKSELPPQEARQPEAQIQETAAGTPNPVVGGVQAGLPMQAAGGQAGQVMPANGVPVAGQQVQPVASHQMQTTAR